MLTLTYFQNRQLPREIVVRTAAVSLLLGIIWVYLAVVFSPVWLPYKFAVSAYRFSRNLGFL